MKKIMCMVTTAITTTMLFATNVFAAVETKQVTDSINGVTSIISTFGRPLFLLVLVICCIAIFTGAEGKRWAKGMIIAAIIAAVGIMYQKEIVDMIWGVKGTASIVLDIFSVFSNMLIL